MKIADFLEVNTIIPDLKSTTKQDVIVELANCISSAHPNINKEKLIEVFAEREKLCSTAIDAGVAVPHAKLSGITDIILGFGRSSKGINYDSLDKKATNFFVTLVAPEESVGAHIQLLARISKIFREPELRSKLLQCESAEKIYQSIIQEDEKY